MNGTTQPAKAPTEWLTLSYHDPHQILRGMREIAIAVSRTATPEPVRNLRTNPLKPFREGRQAALFCFGMSQRLGTRVRFALQPREDHESDVIGLIEENGTATFLPIQLKELPPEHLNPSMALQDLLDRIGSRYVGTADLIVAVHVNRTVRIVVSELILPRNVAEIWLFGAEDETQQKWFLIGNLLSDAAEWDQFEHPGRTLLYTGSWAHGAGSRWAISA